MDISDTTTPRSDQQNYEDYLSGPKDVTVEKVTKGTPEQPVWVHLAEFPGRPFKPSKTVRRILLTAWGRDASEWAGRRMRLYGDPTIRFGGEAVGGIRVSHLSHIDKPLTLALTVTRGKRAPHTVKPLAVDAPAAPLKPTAADAAACDDLEQLRSMWQAATGDRELQALIEARVSDVQAGQQS